LLVTRPGGLLLAGEDSALPVVCGTLLRPHVPVPIAGIAFTRAPEPLVLVGGVIHHKVHENAQPPCTRLMHECHEIAAGPVAGIHPVVVADVVTVVLAR